MWAPVKKLLFYEHFPDWLFLYLYFLFLFVSKLNWTVQPGQCSHNKALLATNPISPWGQPPNQTLIRPSFHWLTGWLSPLLSAASSSSQMWLPRRSIFSLSTANLRLILLFLPCLPSSHGRFLDEVVPACTEGGKRLWSHTVLSLPASGPSHSPSSLSLRKVKRDQLGSFISKVSYEMVTLCMTITARWI